MAPHARRQEPDASHDPDSGSRRVGYSARVPGTYASRQVRPTAAPPPHRHGQALHVLSVLLLPLRLLGAWLSRLAGRLWTSLRPAVQEDVEEEAARQGQSAGRAQSARTSAGEMIMATRMVPGAATAEIAPDADDGAEDQSAASAAVLSMQVDLRLLATVICLLVLGTVFVYSASMYQDYQVNGDVNYYMKKQLISVTLGLIAMYIGARVNYLSIRRWTMPFLIITAVALLAVHVPGIGHSSGGASRWLYFKGQSLQPSELGKLALTIYAATWLAGKPEEVRESITGLLAFLLVLGFTTLLIFQQPDLGTAAVVSGAMVIMFFVSGAKLRHLVVLAALFLPVGYFVTHKGNYWSARIQAWRHPWDDQLGLGYQISRALLAFWHGGLTGVGLGNGQMKDYIPAANSDSIFATIGEETGLIGCLVVVGLFAFFAYRGIRVSLLTSEPFGKLLAAGITSYLVVQALLNMMSVTNTIPFTGVPLPFISYGGNSLVVNLLAVGILLNVSRHIEPIPEERSDLTGTYFWWGNRRAHLPAAHHRQVPVQGARGGWRERNLTRNH